MITVKPWLKRAALISAAPFVLVSTLVMAVNPDTTNLPNGAELSVEIFNPVTDQEYRVPAALGPGGTIDVATDGQASVGEGDPNILLMFAIDGSFSALDECDGDTVLGCEKQAVLNVLADPNIQSVLEVGVVGYGEEGVAGDMTPGGADDLVTNPNTSMADIQTVVNSIFIDPGGVSGDCPAYIGDFTQKFFNCDGTDYTAGLLAADAIVAASSAGILRLLFLSDGLSNQGGGGFAAALGALVGEGVQIDSFAVGASSSCAGGTDGTLQEMADASGGTCTELDDPADIVNELPNLIATSLDAVTATLDGNDVPTNVVPGVPADGPISVLYDATYDDLGVGDYLADAHAEGSDSAGSGSVTAEEPFHLLQLDAWPFDEVNELSEDNAHTVYGQILGGTGPDRDIDFLVGGQNAGTATPGGGSIEATPGGAAVEFDYTVPVSCNSLGQDTITVSTTIGGEYDEIILTKDWVDTIPPEADCVPTENPHGNTEPTAPGEGEQGQNQDGFYELLATDNLVADCEPLVLFITDNGSGVQFGPFGVGTEIKYIQDSDAIPEIAAMGGNNGNGNGQSRDVDYRIKGTGDAVLTAVDQSGNVSAPVNCLVPPPPQ